jgi:hypothetical protein
MEFAVNGWRTITIDMSTSHALETIADCMPIPLNARFINELAVFLQPRKRIHW